MNIREERPADAESIRMVNLSAFDTPAEADLVEALRRHAAPLVSLVAEADAAIVGHILFSPVTLVSDTRAGAGVSAGTGAGANTPALMGLAPMAVVPARRREGIGSRLIAEGLERCRRIGTAAVVVLGHADYYPRFGFVPASRLSLRCEYDVPENAFMVRELHADALNGLSGTIRYHPVFANL